MVPLERQHKMHSPPKNLILLPLNSSQTKENKTYGYLAGRIPLIPSSLPSLADALLLQLSQDLINQRLFEIVRGKHHLVYDTSISFHPHEGIFLISSQSSSYEKSLATVAACKEALHSTQDLSPQDLERHLYRLQERLLEQSQRSEFWVDMLHDHTVLSSFPTTSSNICRSPFPLGTQSMLPSTPSPLRWGNPISPFLNLSANRPIYSRNGKRR